MASYKFDSTKLSLFESYVANGLTETHAAVIAFRIDRATYFRWKQEDSPLKKADKCNIKYAFERGAASINLKLVLIINKAIEKGDGRLALKLLTRIEPEYYGNMTMSRRKSESRTKNDVIAISDEQLRRVTGNMKE